MTHQVSPVVAPVCQLRRQSGTTCQIILPNGHPLPWSGGANTSLGKPLIDQTPDLLLLLVTIIRRFSKHQLTQFCVDEFYLIANVFWMLIGSDWWTYSVCKHCGNTRKWILWRKIPYCVQLPGNRNILRTFLTEPVASDRVDFEYCEPF